MASLVKGCEDVLVWEGTHGQFGQRVLRLLSVGRHTWPVWSKGVKTS